MVSKRQLQNFPPQQNRPFGPFCRSTTKPYSPEYVLGGGVQTASRPRQTDSKSSIFLGWEVLQLPLKILAFLLPAFLFSIPGYYEPWGKDADLKIARPHQQQEIHLSLMAQG